jgi:hypothetical protein
LSKTPRAGLPGARHQLGGAHMLELNAIRTHIREMKERLDVLRGYL